MDVSRTRPDARALAIVRGGAVALAVLATGKFVKILIDEDLDISRAPIVFLVPIVALVAGVVLAARRRSVGVWIIALVSLVLLVVFVLAIANRGLAQQNWADTLLVFAGTPIALAVLAASAQWLRHH